MLLTTNSIQRTQSEVAQAVKQGTRKALYVVKVLGEVTLISFGIIDARKYKDLVQSKYNRE